MAVRSLARYFGQSFYKGTLMKRIHLHADPLAPILPADATEAWGVMEKIQGPPLGKVGEERMNQRLKNS